MFTQLRIQNFKSWADTGDFRMAPLTGLFGTNSSGKTAILQFLLMLKQTVESSDRQRVLHLGGDQYSYVDLGTNYDISHKHRLPEKIKFSLTWTPKLISQSILTIFPETVLKEEGKVGYKIDPYTSSLKFNSVIDIDSDQTSINLFKYSFEAKDSQWNHISLSATKPGDEASLYRLFTEGEIVEDWRNWFEEIYKDFKLILAPSKNYGLHYISTLFSLTVIENLTDMTKAYEDLFQNTYYLAPLREYPKRTYLWSGESPQDVGKRGELTVAALLSARKKDPEVEISVARSLKDLGLIHSFRLQTIAPNRTEYEILVQKSPNSTEVLITDVGFGVSQILPILVLCYYAPKGATLIFEQPEIHLHPSVQAGLADVFIDVIKTRNIQIVIESHSEHLLRRLQRRIAEEKDGFTNEDAALYFCNMSDQGDSELVSLELDPFGNISNWPDGFFGDEMGDLVAMTEASIKRQMNVGA
jgi:AAA15 family ATPase/GTPase